MDHVDDRDDTDDPHRLAAELAELAAAHGRRVATAESLTSGAIASALGAAPDAATWFRGGIVAYSSEVKHDLLDVPPGPVVSATAVEAMARSVAGLLGADLTVAVSGAGGPQPQDGQPVGTVWVATYDRGQVSSWMRRFEGSAPEVVQATVRHALSALLHVGERVRDPSCRP